MSRVCLFYRTYDFPSPYPFSTQKKNLVRGIIGSLSLNVEGVADFLSSFKGQDHLKCMEFSTIYFERDSNFPEIWITDFLDVYRFEQLTNVEKEIFVERVSRKSLSSLVA